MPRYDHPAPHVIELEVRDEDIDAYGHVNNAVYLTLRHPHPPGRPLLGISFGESRLVNRHLGVAGACL